MLKRFHEDIPVSERVSITFEGQTLEVHATDTVIAAVLAAGAGYNRTTHHSCSQRAAYCHMGVCYECLMEIDGIPNQQACKIQVREGMVVNRQYGTKESPHG